MSRTSYKYFQNIFKDAKSHNHWFMRPITASHGCCLQVHGSPRVFDCHGFANDILIELGWCYSEIHS